MKWWHKKVEHFIFNLYSMYITYMQIANVMYQQNLIPVQLTKMPNMTTVTYNN